MLDSALPTVTVEIPSCTVIRASTSSQESGFLKSVVYISFASRGSRFFHVRMKLSLSVCMFNCGKLTTSGRRGASKTYALPEKTPLKSSPRAPIIALEPSIETASPKKSSLSPSLG